MALTMKQTRVQATRAAAPVRKPVLVRASAAAAGEVPSPEKRTTMNLILAGGIGLPVLGLAGPVRGALAGGVAGRFFVPLPAQIHSPLSSLFLFLSRAPPNHSTCRSSCPARE